MNRLFDFECSNAKCGNVFEELIQDDTRTLPCPTCGQASGRQLAAPRTDWRRMGVDPAFPSAWDKWDKAKRQHHKHGKDSLRNGKGTSLLMY
jgi:hypothetical protein